MWNVAIPVLCVLAHLYVLLLFLPGFWREIDSRGFRWHNAVTGFLVPLLVAYLVTSHLLSAPGAEPTWLLVVGFLTVDALLLGVVLTAVALYQRRQRAP